MDSCEGKAEKEESAINKARTKLRLNLEQARSEVEKLEVILSSVLTQPEKEVTGNANSMPPGQCELEAYLLEMDYMTVKLTAYIKEIQNRVQL